MLGDTTITSQTYWINALIWGLIDVALVFILVRFIKPENFRQLKWTLVGTAAIAWGIFVVVLLNIYRDTYYLYIYPAWTIWLAPLDILLYGLVALFLWWAALRLPGNPVVYFCLLGGLESILEHVWGIAGLKILEKVPMLKGASPLSVIVFAVSEYILYWGVVLGIAALMQKIIKRVRLGSKKQDGGR